MTLARLLLGIGIVLIVLSAFGVHFSVVDIFQLGVALCFTACMFPSTRLAIA